MIAKKYFVGDTGVGTQVLALALLTLHLQPLLP
jgi:hypothetical protein